MAFRRRDDDGPHLVVFGSSLSDSFTILGLWVLGLAVSNINESQLQTYESKTLFLMTSLQYYCIPGLARTHWNKNLCAKDAGCAGNEITALSPISTKKKALSKYQSWVGPSLTKLSGSAHVTIQSAQLQILLLQCRNFWVFKLLGYLRVMLMWGSI